MFFEFSFSPARPAQTAPIIKRVSVCLGYEGERFLKEFIGLDHEKAVDSVGVWTSKTALVCTDDSNLIPSPRDKLT